MAQRKYLLAVDAVDPKLDPDRLRAFIRTSPVFTDWWNYLPFVFIVTSDAGPRGVSTALKAALGDVRHLVIEVSVGTAQGLLPSLAWDWLKREADDVVQLPTI